MDEVLTHLDLANAELGGIVRFVKADERNDPDYDISGLAKAKLVIKRSENLAKTAL